MEMIIGLLSGAVGGNAAGKLLGSLDQGTLINSIAGIVGGGIGGTVLSAIGAPDLAGAAGEAGGLDFGASIGQVVGGGGGGGGLLALVGVVRNMMSK